MLAPVAATRARVLGKVVLVTGSPEFLAERMLAEARTAIVDDDPGADVTEAVASTLDAGALAELTSPSLFAASRGVVLRGIDALPDAMHDPLVAYAEAPDPDVAMLLVHPGGVKGKRLLDRLRTAGAREVTVEPPKPWELTDWIVGEARRLGLRVDPDGAGRLHRAVGDDVRSLSAALEQLGSDRPGERISVDLVEGYFTGRAEVKGFDIADRAVAGDRAGALELLRWALAQRVGGPAVTGALATTLRRVIKLCFAPGGLSRPVDLAREVGCSPSQLRHVREAARGWDATGLATAMDAVALADAAVKGASADPGHALERMVLTIVEARSSARS